MISFVRTIISFVRNIILFVRNNISFVRNDFVCTKYYFVCTKYYFVLYEILFRLHEKIFSLYEIIFRLHEILFCFVRNIISFVRNIISFVRNNIRLYEMTGCGPGPDIAGTCVWHSLAGRRHRSDTDWEIGDLGLTWRGPVSWQGVDLGETDVLYWAIIEKIQFVLHWITFWLIKGKPWDETFSMLSILKI